MMSVATGIEMTGYCALVLSSTRRDDRRDDCLVSSRDTERGLQEVYDSPDRYHHEDRDESVEHHNETVVLLFTDVSKVADKSPEKDNDCERDDDTYEAVEESVYGDEHSHETRRLCC